MLLRDSEHKGTATFQQMIDLARDARGSDERGYRAEFIRLAEAARAMGAARVEDAGR